MPHPMYVYYLTDMLINYHDRIYMEATKILLNPIYIHDIFPRISWKSRKYLRNGQPKKFARVCVLHLKFSWRHPFRYSSTYLMSCDVQLSGIVYFYSIFDSLARHKHHRLFAESANDTMSHKTINASNLRSFCI